MVISVPEKEEQSHLDVKKIPKEEYPNLIKELTSQMKLAAANLEFERAAMLRDEISELESSIKKS